MFPVNPVIRELLDRCVESRLGCMYSCRASHPTCSAGQSAKRPNKLISGKARILPTQPIVICRTCLVHFVHCSSGIPAHNLRKAFPSLSCVDICAGLYSRYRELRRQQNSELALWRCIHNSGSCVRPSTSLV